MIARPFESSVASLLLLLFFWPLLFFAVVPVKIWQPTWAIMQQESSWRKWCYKQAVVLWKFVVLKWHCSSVYFYPELAADVISEPAWSKSCSGGGVFKTSLLQSTKRERILLQNSGHLIPARRVWWFWSNFSLLQSKWKSMRSPPAPLTAQNADGVPPSFLWIPSKKKSCSLERGQEKYAWSELLLSHCTCDWILT